MGRPGGKQCRIKSNFIVSCVDWIPKGAQSFANLPRTHTFFRFFQIEKVYEDSHYIYIQYDTGEGDWLPSVDQFCQDLDPIDGHGVATHDLALFSAAILQSLEALHSHGKYHGCLRFSNIFIVDTDYSNVAIAEAGLRDLFCPLAAHIPEGVSRLTDNRHPAQRTFQFHCEMGLHCGDLDILLLKTDQSKPRKMVQRIAQNQKHLQLQKTIFFGQKAT